MGMFSRDGESKHFSNPKVAAGRGFNEKGLEHEGSMGSAHEEKAHSVHIHANEDGGYHVHVHHADHSHEHQDHPHFASAVDHAHEAMKEEQGEGEEQMPEQEEAPEHMPVGKATRFSHGAF